MRTILLLLLVAAAGRAQEPVTGQGLDSDNERTVEGDIERFGDEYRVRRNLGITAIPAERVLKLCESKQDARGLLRRRANSDDPEERLRLARWCHVQGLREEALVEAR